MATYDVTVHFRAEDRDNLPGLLVEDILSELSCCWHTLDNLSIVMTGDIVAERAGPFEYSSSMEMVVYTEKYGYLEPDGNGGWRPMEGGRSVSAPTAEGGADG